VCGVKTGTLLHKALKALFGFFILWCAEEKRR
jgi:hypothetical protein